MMRLKWLKGLDPIIKRLKQDALSLQFQIGLVVKKILNSRKNQPNLIQLPTTNLQQESIERDHKQWWMDQLIASERSTAAIDLLLHE